MLSDLNDVVLFAEVARTRSFTRAAQALGIPKSTVSRRLARLEAELGQRLLERTTRQVTLTATGEAWSADAAQVVHAVESARLALGALAAEPRGTLKLALPVDFAVHWLAAPLASFASRYPSITLALDLAPREVDVVGERFDAAIRIGRMRDSSLATRHIADIARGLYASPLYLAERPAPKSIAALAGLRMVDFPGRELGRIVLTRARDAQPSEVVLSVAASANNVGMLRALALAGAGVAVLPDVLCASEVAAGRLVRLLPQWRAEPTVATLVMPSRRLVPTKLRLLIEHLREQLGQ